MKSIEIYADSSRGIYIPQFFAESHSEEWSGISEKDLSILKSGPNNGWYWDTWTQVLDLAEYTDKSGNTYYLHQDGDLFAYCPELMTADEKVSLFGI